MSTVSLTQVAPQVKSQIAMPSRQALLTQRINEELAKAVLFNRNAATVEIDGAKFTCQASMSSYDRDYNLYHVILPKAKATGQYEPYKPYATLDQARKDLFKSPRKVIKSGTVLKTVFMSKLGTVMAVDNQAEVVERFVAEVCKELGWQYVSPRKAAFNERVAMLHGDQSYID